MNAGDDRYADAVIVAAGSSRRMDGVDKLDADLGGATVLSWAVRAAAQSQSVRRAFVVVPPERVQAVSALDWIQGLGATVVAGGARRQDSVAAGVRAAQAEVVLVHDGARPLATPSLVDAVAAAAREHGAAIPVVPVVDSLRRVEGGRVREPIDRDGLYAAQTPQGARRALLLDAVEALSDGTEEFSDEAELLRRFGTDVAVVPGERTNFKITVPEDLTIARAMLNGSIAGAPRVGFGTDSHPFGPTIGLRLGGIDIPDAPRLLGHSDGDAALHAVCDALLGAAGLPDLGRAFPASDPETQGVDSARLLATVVEQLSGAGWRPASLDVTIVGSRPRLGGSRLDAMAAVIGELVGLPVSRVGVKASSGNLSGDEGAGRVISASAVATVVPA
jgi:2-C-methyl-D-erythritol 4-phosphate cytidylyltransferase/2-C-methyl-D-erythritol 2,4-cyclodiphosphate synthase